MGIKQQIEADIKTAMLAGDKKRATILRTIKSVILDAEISKGKREEGLSEPELVSIISKEAKKRQDAAELYKTAGEQEREQNETLEHQILTDYLPKQLDDTELENIVVSVISEQQGPIGLQDMGKIIAAVREKSEGKADGSRIAAAVKAKIA